MGLFLGITITNPKIPLSLGTGAVNFVPLALLKVFIKSL